jgi:hypothetical protein
MITSSTEAGLHSKVGNLDLFRRLQIALPVFIFFLGLLADCSLGPLYVFSPHFGNANKVDGRILNRGLSKQCKSTIANANISVA